MTQGLIPIKRVLVCVQNETGIEAICQELRAVNPQVELIASEKNHRTLALAHCPSRTIQEYTLSSVLPQEGVMPLHPKIFDGILFSKHPHGEALESQGVLPFDLVICNLQEFPTGSKEDLAFLMDQIEVAPPPLLQACAKNFTHVAVVTHPKAYLKLAQEIRSTGGCTSIGHRAQLAQQALELCADYTVALSTQFSRALSQEEVFHPKFTQGRALKCGANPHQKAWVYQVKGEEGVATTALLNGPQMTYAQYEDSTLAMEAVQSLHALDEHSCSVALTKQGALCGLSTAPTVESALKQAWAPEGPAASGGTIALSQCAQATLIPLLENRFIEVLIAPEFSPTFLAWAKERKRSLRLLPLSLERKDQVNFKKVSGGLLLQVTQKHQGEKKWTSLTQPASPQAKRKVGVVTQRSPEKNQEGLFQFGLAAIQLLRSCAIAIVREVGEKSYQLLSSGSGQPHRTDALERLALPKAREALHRENSHLSHYQPEEELSRCILVSDGYLPKPESLQAISRAGLIYCLQPGGSARDGEVIEAADAQELCMIFSGESALSP